VATGPCSWAIEFNECCECWDALDPGAQARALNYATTVLWAATGKQFGQCPQTVRPCGRYCNGNAMGMIWNNGLYSPWIPYILNGVWRNCWCGCGDGPGCCSCEPSQQVYLPGPVTGDSTTIVVIQDGVLVPSSSYRVDDAKWLVRTDGLAWPECQNFNVDAGLGIFNDNTLQVTYLRGEAPPQALLDAAATLACEFAKACRGLACRLPGRLSTVARQGVQLTFQNIDFLIDNMFTGIPEVDQIIKAYNPYGLARPMRIWSPDLPVTRQVTTP
jgi:hypothetical protein